MAYVNVAEWSPDQVSEWLKGLDDVILPYIHYFVNNQVDGKRLLQLSHDELPSLNVTKIGHQEIILQGVELLRNIHYHLHQENVQYLALRLSSKARSIYNELRAMSASSRGGGGSAGEEEDGEEDDDGTGGDLSDDKKKQERVSTAVIAGVADVLSSVKGVVSWLNRQPFEGIEQYDSLKSDLVELSIRLATIAQRDMFAENQATVILQSCLKLANISDKIIQEYNDPLIIQPASLDVATIKKKADDELGVVLQSSYHGVHQVSGVRALSPAHQCGKLQEGDELVQVSYQTVVGWAPHKVAAIMQEFPVEVILTVKKRPSHSNTVTQIYFKPFRLPSKKRTYSPWVTSVASSPRYDLHSIPNLQLSVSVDKTLPRTETKEPRPRSLTPPPAQNTPPSRPLSSLSNEAPNTTSDSEPESDLEDDPFLSDSDVGGSSPISARLYHPKPRAPVQRRATIPGATTRPSFSFDQLLQDVRWQRGGRSPDGPTPSDPDLRSTAGVEQRATRPHTCIGTEKKDRIVVGGDGTGVKEEEAEGKDVSKNFSSHGNEESTKEQPADVSEEKRIVNVIPLPPRKPTGQGIVPSVVELQYQHDHGSDDKTRGTSLSPSQNASKKSKPATLSSQLNTSDKTSKAGQELKLDISTRQRRVSEDRPKLDKSHSTPAYDLEEENTLQGVASPALTPIALEKSPANQASSPRFFNTDTKTAFVSCGDTTPHLSREGQSVQASRGSQPKLTSIISSATTNIGDGATQHYKSQVIFPVSAASNSTTPGTHSATRSEGSDGNKDDKHITNDGGGSKRQICSSEGGGDPWNEAKVIGSTGVGGGVERQPEISAGAMANPEPSAVVLRETRSSSPSVWRRGLLVADQGSRRISCRELGQGDHQGWLLRRRDNKGFLLPHRWERRWFILKKNYLYGYRDREAVRADSLIYLPGFHVCPAPDVKSKKYSFKIYHSSGATFYFACETAEERSRWMSQMGLSAISSGSQSRQHHHAHQQNAGDDVYYSETDEEIEDRSSPSRRSPQSPQSRISPTKELSSSLWRGGSASPARGPHTRTQPLSSITSTLGSAKGQGLKFLQSSRDTLNQPVPTASYRSYRRVSESSTRSTSTGDLRGGARPELPVTSQAEVGGASDGTSSRRVTRKNSLRDRLRQLPASLTLERRRQVPNRSGQIQQQPSLPQQQQSQQQQLKPSKPLPKQKDNKDEIEHEVMHMPEGLVKKNETPGQESGQDIYVSIVEQQIHDISASSSEGGGGAYRQCPHYMLPTRASSHHTPVRPSSVDLDTRTSPSRSGNGRWSGTPPPSGRSSPSKLDLTGRRGSIGGESPLRPHSPRRGSLDCLATSRPRALSPPISPLHTPTRSSHGSTSSLLASEEYREGSPEKHWISSLRSDSSRQRPTTRSSPEKREGRARSGSGEGSASDRLKHTALYHPLQMRNRGDPMKATFELSLDPSTSQIHVSDSTHSGRELLQSITSNSPQSMVENEAKSIIVSPKRYPRDTPRMHSTPRPEVPPRTKFLSPSERTLPSSTSLSTSASNLPQPSTSNMSGTPSTKSTSSLPTYPSSQYSRTMASPERMSQGHSIGHGAGQSRTSKPVLNLTIRTHGEESDALRTPLKPAMGVAMIGKQRRTPGVLSPRDVFFSSPPSSPTTPFSPNIPPLMAATPTTSMGIPTIPISGHQYSSQVKAKATKLQQQKVMILPHYPGMEYPPVFEPGSYSLCGSPPEPIYQVPGTPMAVITDSQTSDVSAPMGTFMEEAESSETNGGSLTLATESREAKSQVNIYVPSFASSGSESTLHPNLVMASTSGTRAHQNLYVSSPSSLRSHQNLYVTSPSGSVSNQNVYVSAPSRSNVQQSIDVTTPQRPATIGFSGPGCSSYQNVFVTNVSDSNSGILKERQKSMSSLEECENTAVLKITKSPSRPPGPPRLLLPGPPETPPSDNEADLTTSSTQTEA